MFSMFKKPSEMALSIEGEFRHGEITMRNIDAQGISYLGVTINSIPIEVSWYSALGDRHRSISIDGKALIPDGLDSKIIINAAIDRAYGLIKSDLKTLSRRLKQGE